MSCGNDGFLFPHHSRRSPQREPSAGMTVSYGYYGFIPVVPVGTVSFPPHPRTPSQQPAKEGRKNHAHPG